MKKNNCFSDADLSFYCTGDLNPLEMKAVAEHLTHCTECNLEIASIQTTLATLPKLDISLTEAEKLKFSDRVAQAADRRLALTRLPFLRSALTVVGVALFTFVLFNPGNLSPTKQTPTRQLAEIDLVENAELLEMMDLLEVMDLLEQLEERG